jgi:uncharacterized protein (DUF2141 family)
LKKIPIVIVAAAAALAALGGAAGFGSGPREPSSTGPATLHVELGGVAGGKGNLMGAVCSRESFLKQCQYLAMRPAGEARVLEFSGVAPGSYAVMVYHDENGDGRLDRAASGMPLEGYGFSRNARGKYGPPAFDDARIDLRTGANRIALDMVY